MTIIARHDHERITLIDQIGFPTIYVIFCYSKQGLYMFKCSCELIYTARYC